MRTHHHQRQRRLRFGVVGVVGVLAAPSVVPATAHAAATSTAACVFEFVMPVAPGVSMTPADFTYTTGGETGMIICVGTVRGHPVTGPGTVGEQGTGNGSCSGGTVTGAYTMTIPTDAGQQRLRVPYTKLNFVGPLGARPTPELAGGFTFVPTRGDCVTTPITEVVLAEFGVLLT
ncbi:MAG TPA: hypothetical protein VMY88_01225 [Acidimicrobiales bacterium]|nr:hypothetical protein [Acidimicrobiales bacterium]